MRLELKMLPPIRIVVDSNVIISAFNFGGVPALVMSASLDPTITLYLSPFILDEVASVLKMRFAWKPGRLQRVREVLEKRAAIINPMDRLERARDENDNRILECALAAHAHYLVSGDEDLLSLKKHGQTKIVTPAHFLAIVRKK